MTKKELPGAIKRNLEKSDFLSTVKSVILNVFPAGTVMTPSGKISHRTCPRVPQDVFAVTGILLEDSGAMSFHGFDTSKPHKDYPKLGLDGTTVSLMEKIGEAWAKKPNAVPKEVRDRWKELLEYEDFPLSYRAYRFSKRPKRNQQYWWKLAYELFIISDAACEDIGFTPFEEGERSFSSQFWDTQIESILEQETKNNRPNLAVKNIELRSSLASMADPDVVCVQPKALFPTVGAGTRVFSKNLALLRSRGLVRVQWCVNTHIPSADANPGLNILAIPFPYSYEKDELNIQEIKDASKKQSVKVFRLNQNWLAKKKFETFKSTCKKLISKCKKNDALHAIVLPELALNQDRFIEFAEYVKQLAPELEFIVSGSKENCEENPKSGNYIWIRKFRASDEGNHTAKDTFFDVSQSKHHRWKIDNPQMAEYSFGHDSTTGMAANEDHWENFAGRPREVNFLAFRRHSSFCGVVCEDLARSEPCHEVIRSVGPNLIFGLLMDGPQIEQRWGAKYSSIFAADHGCAVMTISSRALVEKSQKHRDADERSYSVVYFRSPGMEKAVDVPCEDKNCGVFIQLLPSTSTNLRRLIDGRSKHVVDWVINPDEKRQPRVIRP